MDRLARGVHDQDARAPAVDDQRQIVEKINVLEEPPDDGRPARGMRATVRPDCASSATARPL